MDTYTAGSLCWLAVVLIGALSRPNIQYGVDGAQANYERLFVFGDSYADTGNHDRFNQKLNTPWRPPYGITWPGYPTGRYSDGRVLTDFYASYLKVPSPPPYGDNILQNFGATGTNFAYGGSGVYPTFGLEYPTLNFQTDKLKQLMAIGAVSSTMLKTSMALVVIAGNDYRAFVERNQSVVRLPKLVSKVADGIGVCVEQLYKMGFKGVTVTNLQPVGCLPYQTSSIGFSTCNEVATMSVSVPHNSLLGKNIAILRRRYKDANIMSLDLYNAFNVVIKGEKFSLTPCCKPERGSECGDVDNNGNALFTVCPSPQDSLFWDTFHPTNAGWTAISEALLSDA